MATLLAGYPNFERRLKTLLGPPTKGAEDEHAGPRSLIAQINDARAHVRQMKRVAPWLYHEWQRLKEAERAFKAAQKELAAARLAWKNFAAKDHP